MADKGSSGDAGGAFAPSGGDKPERGGAGEVANLRAVIANIARLNGTATLVVESTFVAINAAIYSKFKATTSANKQQVDQTLTYYFSVHGTSPDTEWATYDYPIVALGKYIPPKEIVDEIGLHRLKKFMGRYTSLAIAMVKASPELQAALGERAAKAGCAPGQEYMAIDFVGKDGSLGHSEMTTRVVTRENLLSQRANNVNNISEMRAASRKADAKTSDARSLQPSRPVMSFD